MERLLKAEPAAFMSKRNAKLVKAGNIEDDLAALAECDWIVEAVVERLDVKQALYRKIDAVRKPGTAVSSNTSTIPLAALTEGLSDGFRRDFLITHFFNPPRYMRLLEIVSGPETDPATVARVSAFADVKLGKTVVTCKDTPGFIANRLGTYWMQLAVGEAFALGLTVEEADSVMGRPFGIPKTGVFGLLDLVGLDLMPHVQGSLERALPKDDPFQKTVRDIPLIRTMIETGLIGRKGKGGFYRLNRDGGGKVKEAIDLASGSYRREEKARLPEVEAAAKNVGALLGATTPAGRYAVSVMARTLAYAAWLVPAAADDVVAIDDAMRLGYNWKWGPFELIDRIGAPTLITALEGMGEPVPEFLTLARDKTFYRVENGKRQYLGRDGTYRDIVRPEGVLLLSDIKLTAQPVLKNGSAAVWDLGDGVLCFEFTSKSNSLDEGIITLLGKASKLVKDKHKALVIYNEGSNFSVGANLGLALFACNIAAFGEVEKLVAAGQQAYQALKYAPFPGGLRTGGHGARRRVRDSLAFRCRAGPCGELYRPRGMRRRRAARLGRLQGDADPLADRPGPAKGPHARALQGVRDGEHRHRVEIRRRGQGIQIPARERRHHHEPRPPAGGRQGQGACAGGKLCAAEARGPDAARPFRPRGAGNGG